MKVFNLSSQHIFFHLSSFVTNRVILTKYWWANISFLSINIPCSPKQRDLVRNRLVTLKWSTGCRLESEMLPYKRVVIIFPFKLKRYNSDKSIVCTGEWESIFSPMTTHFPFSQILFSAIFCLYLELYASVFSRHTNQWIAFSLN